MLSIVIPCYNSVRTLRQAVDSCYRQGFSELDFEIVLVDDRSKDSTAELMRELAREHGNIRCLFHEQNFGGGAARNSGIKAAKGDLVYCLDSDNVLVDESMPKLVSYLKEKGVDGVSFHERRFFIGEDLTDYDPLYATVLDREIKLADLFTEPAVLLDNFLFTKESFARTKGFPDHHGFDTQGFEMRYLGAGNRVLVCPNSAFYHRQMAKEESYFEREYNKGNFSLYYFFCVEEIFDALHDDAKALIARYDVFKNSSLEKNILKELKGLHAQGRLFKRPDDKASPSRAISRFSDGISLYRAGMYRDACARFREAIDGGLTTPVVYYCVARCETALSGIERRLIERIAVESSPLFKTNPRKLFKASDRLDVLRKLKTTVKNLIRWR